MPYKISKVRGKDLYSVKNTATGAVHSYGTTMKKAKAQVRLLQSLDEKVGGYMSDEEMSDEEMEYDGEMSDDEIEYEDEMEGGKMAIGDVKKLLKSSYNKKPSDINGFKIDKSLSGERVQVYTDKDGRAYVVHRGTQGFQDVLTDVKMLFGKTKSQKRFKHAEKIQREAEAKYGAENVSTLGHSLGARVAEEVGKRGKEIITYNKPTLPVDLITQKKLPDKQFDIRTSRDPVSILQPFQKGSADLVIPSKSLNPLVEHTTDALGRVSEDMMVGSGSWFGSNLLNDIKWKIM